MKKEFCFCQLDFKVKVEYSRNREMWIRETSNFESECVAFKMPIRFNKGAIKSALMKGFD